MKNLGESLQELLKQFNLEKPYKRSKVFDLWSDVVGERMAAKTNPIRVEHGTLYVQVESSAWRNEVQYYKNQIKSEINCRLGEEIIEKIVFF